MADNTTLNPGIAGDEITTESLEDGEGRGIAGLPTDDYKLPRSKIIVGPYGRDDGDATHDRPLPVESRAERWAAERAMLQSMEVQPTRAGERGSSVDRRGNGGWRGTTR